MLTLDSKSLKKIFSLLLACTIFLAAFILMLPKDKKSKRELYKEDKNTLSFRKKDQTAFLPEKIESKVEELPVKIDKLPKIKYKKIKTVKNNPSFSELEELLYDDEVNIKLKLIQEYNPLEIKLNLAKSQIKLNYSKFETKIRSSESDLESYNLSFKILIENKTAKILRTKLHYNNGQIPKELLSLAFQIVKKLDFQQMESKEEFTNAILELKLTLPKKGLAQSIEKVRADLNL